MTQTIVALYDDFTHVQQAVQEMVDAGFDRSDISIVANDADGRIQQSGLNPHDPAFADVKPGDGAGFGAIIGTLVGLGVALIPGVGPVLAAGPLAAALMAGIGAAAGAVTGGMVAGLIDMGVTEEDAAYYAEGIRRGGVLVSVSCPDEWANRAEDILNRHHPVDLDNRTTTWRESGWSGFDTQAPMYTRDEIESERTRYRSSSQVPNMSSDAARMDRMESQFGTQTQQQPNRAGAGLGAATGWGAGFAAAGRGVAVEVVFAAGATRFSRASSDSGAATRVLAAATSARGGVPIAASAA